MGEKHKVRFEPVDIEIEVDEDETVLDAAFRHGVMLMHMEGKDGVEVSRFPAMLRIDGENMLEFDLDEIAEALGVKSSTHYGRMVRLNDRVMVFANPEDAAEYLGFEPPSEQVSDSDDGPTLPA